MQWPPTADHVIMASNLYGVVGDEIDATYTQGGCAFARLVRGSDRNVVVGHDMRTGTAGLAEAFDQGAMAEGVDVIHAVLRSFGGPRILLCAKGSLSAHNKSQVVSPRRGGSAWVPTSDGPICLVARHRAEVFVASVCGVPETKVRTA